MHYKNIQSFIQMTTVTVNIPEKELDFFLKLLRKFKLKTVVNEIDIIPIEVKKEMIHRKKTAKAKDYVKAHDSLTALKKKYGV